MICWGLKCGNSPFSSLSVFLQLWRANRPNPLDISFDVAFFKE